MATEARATAESRVRLHADITGAVQGVGFRPFVYRLARELDLCGWVLNGERGVELEVEGPRTSVERFALRLGREVPARAVVADVAYRWAEPRGYADFRIVHSRRNGAPTLFVLPDIATCDACRAEILDPTNRRHRYPFTNCTNCGPRFSIVRALPYDRVNTSMAGFDMCPACQAEYDDPADRRFHTQPNACPACGPGLALWTPDGRTVAGGVWATEAAAAAVLAGRIVAVKGLGGFHLIVDANDNSAIMRLRARKGRYEKPMALMVPDLDTARRLCEVDREAEKALTSYVAPIVLLLRRPDAAVAEGVAPGNPYLGIMLPYTPLHHLLMRELGVPVVATSGNLGGEPICTDEADALLRLGGIADLFLVHDRPIVRHVDDSVVTLHGTRLLPLRRARGMAPLPLRLGTDSPTVLAVGAHLKNVIALAIGSRAFLSQHLGDMDTPRGMDAFRNVVADFMTLYDARPAAVVHDLHPGYPTTRWAREATGGARRIAVQHHHAHLAACLTDVGATEPALGVTWDGTGDGGDGTVWGGEFLLGDARSAVRVATLRPFRLLGGEVAVWQPRRVALALLAELSDEVWTAPGELAPVAGLPDADRVVLRRMWQTGLNSPWCTSAGRLFDGVAALAGLRQRVSFEAQAAMALEFAADTTVHDAYLLPVQERGTGPPGPGNPPLQKREAGSHGSVSPPVPDAPGLLELDWRPLIEAILRDIRRGVDVCVIAARFHNALAAAVARVAAAFEAPRVALTGGCFQNRLLAVRVAEALEREGVDVLMHRQVPPNDGGIALGQVAVARATWSE